MEEDVARRMEILRKRQEQWMRERESEREREQAVAELQRDTILSADAAADGNGGNGGALQPAQIMDKLTERLADRLKTEIREELQREGKERKLQKDHRERQLEGSLVKELESNTCPICYELMVCPAKAPTLLFPCGHTFCAECIKRHLQLEGKKNCPFCRAVVESRAPNMSLQQLIQAYVQRRGKGIPNNTNTKEQYEAPPPNESQTPEQGRMSDANHCEDYSAQQKQLAVRIRILRNEREDSKFTLADLRSRQEGCHSVLVHLSGEEERLQQQIKALEAELSLVREHLSEQQRKVKEIGEAKDGVVARQGLVDETLQTLEREYNKVCILAEGLREGLRE